MILRPWIGSTDSVETIRWMAPLYLRSALAVLSPNALETHFIEPVPNIASYSSPKANRTLPRRGPPKRSE